MVSTRSVLVSSLVVKECGDEQVGVVRVDGRAKVPAEMTLADVPLLWPEAVLGGHLKHRPWAAGNHFLHDWVVFLEGTRENLGERGLESISQCDAGANPTRYPAPWVDVDLED